MENKLCGSSVAAVVGDRLPPMGVIWEIGVSGCAITRIFNGCRKSAIEVSARSPRKSVIINIGLSRGEEQWTRNTGHLLSNFEPFDRVVIAHSHSPRKKLKS